MEELRLGAAASVDRAGPRIVVQNTYVYINLRVSGETRVRPNDPLTLHLKSRLVFSRGSSTIRILFRCPILTINESLLRHQNSETPQGILPLPRHLPD